MMQKHQREAAGELKGTGMAELEGRRVVERRRDLFYRRRCLLRCKRAFMPGQPDYAGFVEFRNTSQWSGTGHFHRTYRGE